MVKKVKGRAYVYLHGRDQNGKVRTIYIDSLEKIVKTYLAVNGINEENLRFGRLAGLESRTSDV